MTTWRQRRNLRKAMGLHPLAGIPLANNGRLCRHCAHCISIEGLADKTIYKCDLTMWTHSPATDVSTTWPACEKFIEKERES